MLGQSAVQASSADGPAATKVSKVHEVKKEPKEDGQDGDCWEDARKNI